MDGVRLSICEPSRPLPRSAEEESGLAKEQKQENALPILPGASRGKVLPKEKSEERNKARRLLRLADAQARSMFLQTHPFFQGTSQSLRERLAPQLVRRSNDKDNGRANVLEQGAEPNDARGGMDYLFLTPPDVHTSIEVLFDGKPISTIGGNGVFGQEVIFGVSKRFIFGTRVASGSLSSLWVVPRAVVRSLLQREVFRHDWRLLKQRAHDTVVAHFRNWYGNPTTNLRIRLFDIADHAVKSALAEDVELQVVPEGAVVIHEDTPQDVAICIWRGEADVMQRKSEASSLLRLSHAPGSTAWAAWWGLWELLGISSTSKHAVHAVTDCIVWRITHYGFRRIAKQYPAEAKLLEKVGFEQMKMLQDQALQIKDSSLFSAEGTHFLKELQAIASRRFVPAREVICDKGRPGPGREMFFIHRGKVMQRLPTGRVVSQEGEVLGLTVALSVENMRPCVATAQTACDVSVIPGDELLELIAKYPETNGLFLRMLEDSNISVPKTPEDLSTMKLFDDFTASEEFLPKLLSKCATLKYFKEQTVLTEGTPMNDVLILFTGSVTITRKGKDGVSPMRAPAIFGSEAAMAEDNTEIKIADLSVQANELCGFLAVKVSTVIKLLAADDPDVKEEWEAMVLDEMLAVQAAMAGNTGRGRSYSRFSSRTSLNGSFGQGPVDDEEEKFIQETLLKRFEGADTGFLDAISNQLYKQVWSQGEVIMEQDAPGDFALIIAAGSCSVKVDDIKVGEVHVGGMIGEACLLGKGKRGATVQATEEVTGFMLYQQKMAILMREYPEERARLVEMMKLREDANKALIGKNSTAGKVLFQKAAKMVSLVNSMNSTTRGAKEETTTPTTKSKARSKFDSPGRRASFGSMQSSSSEGEGRSSSKTVRRASAAVQYDGIGENDDDDEEAMDEGQRRVSLRPASFRRSSYGAGQGRKASLRCGTPPPGMSDTNDANELNKEKPSTAPAAFGARTGLGDTKKPRTKLDRWASDRSQKISEAPIRQEARMALAGRITPLIPKDRSFIWLDSSRCSTMTPTSSRQMESLSRGLESSSSRMSSVTPVQPSVEIGLGHAKAAGLQLKKALKLYGKPIWHEVW